MAYSSLTRITIGYGLLAAILCCSLIAHANEENLSNNAQAAGHVSRDAESISFGDKSEPVKAAQKNIRISKITPPEDVPEEPLLAELLPMVYELQNHLVLDVYPHWAGDLDWQRLRVFYADNDFQAVWLEDTSPTERAARWLDTLQHAANEGLNSDEYHVKAIQALWTAKRIRSKARLELLLTDAFFRYSVEVGAGYQYPRVVDNDWYLRGPKVKPIRLLKKALSAENIYLQLDDLPPPHPGYHRLKMALKLYEFYASNGRWIKIPRGRTLRLGSWDYQVSLLRQRLLQEGYMLDELPVDEYLYDRELERIVIQYQTTHGLGADGIVGAKTRKALNVSVNERMNQIRYSMERWRWLPRKLGQRYVMVNMAGYRLYLVEEGKTTLNMPVIIGKLYRSTPAFKDRIRYLEFNPRWNIPTRIAKEDLLPRQVADENFLKSKNIGVFESWKLGAKEIDMREIDWANISLDRFPYRLQQKPGDFNSLGRVKFMFPNSFSVYLHDTPSKHLFKRSVRTFSSGCIRVSRPVSLATHLLGKENGWQASAVRKMINTYETLRIDLKKSVPIYLLYWTTWVEEDGTVHFRDDVYQRNQRIVSLKSAPKFL